MMALVRAICSQCLAQLVDPQQQQKAPLCSRRCVAMCAIHVEQVAVVLCLVVLSGAVLGGAVGESDG